MKTYYGFSNSLKSLRAELPITDAKALEDLILKDKFNRKDFPEVIDNRPLKSKYPKLFKELKKNTGDLWYGVGLYLAGLQNFETLVKSTLLVEESAPETPPTQVQEPEPEQQQQPQLTDKQRKLLHKAALELENYASDIDSMRGLLHKDAYYDYMMGNTKKEIDKLIRKIEKAFQLGS